MKLSNLAAFSASLMLVAVLVTPAQARGDATTQAIEQSNFATRDAQLRQQIHSEVAAAQLDPTVGANLIGELDHIAARVQRDIAYEGGISDFEADRIVSMFGDVTAQLNGSTVVRSYAAVYPYNSNNRYFNRHRYGWRSAHPRLWY